MLNEFSSRIQKCPKGKWERVGLLRIRSVKVCRCSLFWSWNARLSPPRRMLGRTGNITIHLTGIPKVLNLLPADMHTPAKVRVAVSSQSPWDLQLEDFRADCASLSLGLLLLYAQALQAIWEGSRFHHFLVFLTPAQWYYEDMSAEESHSESPLTESSKEVASSPWQWHMATCNQRRAQRDPCPSHLCLCTSTVQGRS